MSEKTSKQIRPVDLVKVRELGGQRLVMADLSGNPGAKDAFRRYEGARLNPETEGGEAAKAQAAAEFQAALGFHPDELLKALEEEEAQK